MGSLLDLGILVHSQAEGPVDSQHLIADGWRRLQDDSSPNPLHGLAMTLRKNWFTGPSQSLELWKVITKWLLCPATEFWRWLLHGSGYWKRTSAPAVFSVHIALTFLFSYTTSLHKRKYHRNPSNGIPKPPHPHHGARSYCFVIVSWNLLRFFWSRNHKLFLSSVR